MLIDSEISGVALVARAHSVFVEIATDGDLPASLHKRLVVAAVHADLPCSVLTELEGKGDLANKFIDYLIAQELKDNSKWIINGEGTPIVDLK